MSKFNAYSIRLWHVFLLLGSLRAVNDTLGLLNQFNLTAGLAWISDKEGRASGDAQRLVPMCDFLVRALQDYLEYLTQVKRLYGKLNKGLAIGIDKILRFERPLLNVISEQYQLQPLSPKIVKKHLGLFFRFKADWSRHLGQKHLHEQGVDESLILSVFGHEMSEQESWQKHSSISLGDVMGLKAAYQSLAVRLNLEQIA